MRITSLIIIIIIIMYMYSTYLGQLHVAMNKIWQIQYSTVQYVMQLFTTSYMIVHNVWEMCTNVLGFGTQCLVTRLTAFKLEFFRL